MGIFTNLFGSNPLVAKPPELHSVFPQVAWQKIQSGKLPTIQSDKLILNAGEICHFVDVAAIVTEKTRYKSRRVGGSYRIWRGFTMHTGDSTSVPITEPEYTKGILFITNKRIVFFAEKYGFDQKIIKLSAKKIYSDAITLQFGNKTYGLLLPNGDIVQAVLDLIL